MEKGLTDLEMMGARPSPLGSISDYGLEDEVLLYSSRSERVFSLNSSAKAIWDYVMAVTLSSRLVRNSASASAALATSCLVDIIDAISKFREHGLLELEEASRAEVR